MTNVRIAQRTDRVVVGVDTHADVHVAAALDSLGRMLGRLEVATNTRGYAQLLRWAQTFSSTLTFGCRRHRCVRRGTGALPGQRRLCRHRDQPARSSGATWTWQVRPDRCRGRSAIVLAGGDVCIAKSDDDRVGMIRTLRVARRSAIKMRTQVGNQMHALVVTAPDPLRHQLRDLALDRLVAVTAATRPGAVTTSTAATKLSLRSLAIRHQGLSGELSVLDRELGRLTVEASPELSELVGSYVARRTAEGMAKRDIVRCLKRYVSREVFRALLATHPPAYERSA